MNSTTLRFVSAGDWYSTYLDVDGDEVYLARGTAKRLEDAFDLGCVLDDFHVWRSLDQNNYLDMNFRLHRDVFTDWLRGQYLDDLDEIDQIEWCNDCHEPEEPDSIYGVKGGYHVCESCLERYSWCSDCEEHVPGDVTATLSDDHVCDRCRDANWTFCQWCDGYRSDESYDHDHDNSCDCTPMEMRFGVPNQGDTLRNDERVTVTIGSGVISDEGVGDVALLIRQHGDVLYRDGEIDAYAAWHRLSYELAALGREWQTKDGNFPKRLSRFAYKTHGVKIPSEMVSEIGNIARAQSQGVEVNLEVTRNLNLSAGDFYHEGSCWWTDHSESRCALKSNAGFALRTFGGYYNNVQGRAWVIPMRWSEGGLGGGSFEPTYFEPDGYVVFNGYGDLEGYSPARILAQMFGMTYRKVGLEAGPMYINNDSGYLVTREEIAETFTDGHLHLDADEHSNLHYYENQRALANA